VPYTLRYDPRVADHDLVKIPTETRRRIARLIEARLATSPERFGMPLRALGGYWKLRVGDYRVVYKIAEDEVWILAVMPRKDVYPRASRRLP